MLNLRRHTSTVSNKLRVLTFLSIDMLSGDGDHSPGEVKVSLPFTKKDLKIIVQHEPVSLAVLAGGLSYCLGRRREESLLQP